jgi:hypothetical protein
MMCAFCEKREAVSDLTMAFDAEGIPAQPSCYRCAELGELSGEVTVYGGHAHRWNADDYCDECGADGRA